MQWTRTHSVMDQATAGVSFRFLNALSYADGIGYRIDVSSGAFLLLFCVVSGQYGKLDWLSCLSPFFSNSSPRLSNLTFLSFMPSIK